MNRAHLISTHTEDRHLICHYQIKTKNKCIVSIHRTPYKTTFTGSIYKSPKNISKYFPKKEGLLKFIIVYNNSKSMYYSLNQMRKKQRRKYI